jgi:hypothetical protein
VKLARFRKSKDTCFLSSVEDRCNINISIIIYTYKHILNIFPKVGLLEETKEGGKEEKNNTVNNNEIHHRNVGLTQHTEDS